MPTERDWQWLVTEAFPGFSPQTGAGESKAFAMVSSPGPGEFLWRDGDGRAVAKVYHDGKGKVTKVMDLTADAASAIKEAGPTYSDEAPREVRERTDFGICPKCGDRQAWIGGKLGRCQACNIQMGPYSTPESP